MANHEYARVGNVWASLSDLTSAEMQVIDFNAADGISGTGGAYAFTEPLIFGGVPGANFELQLPFSATDEALFSGNDFECYSNSMVFGSGPQAFYVNAHASLVGSVTQIGASGADALVVHAFTNFVDVVNFDEVLFVNNDATFIGAVLFNGQTTIGSGFDDDLFVNANAVFANSVSFLNTAAVSFAGATTHTAPITIATGAYIKKRLFVMPNASASKGPREYERMVVDAAILSGAQTFTIDDTDATDDAAFQCSTLDTLHEVLVKSPLGVDIGILSTTTGLGKWRWFDLQRVAGVWRIVNGQLA